MKRTSAAAFIFVLIVEITHFAAQHPTSRNPYPNELHGFEFYVRYLAPLRPYFSDEAAIVQVLGSDQGKTIEGWRMWPLNVGDAGPAKGRLAEVRLVPSKSISMLGVRFPAAFSRALGGVSEVNVTCDVYSDRSGLQYWLYAKDSAVGKKGDLMQIVYGASDEVKRKWSAASR